MKAHQAVFVATYPLILRDIVNIRCDKKSNPPNINSVELLDLTGRIIKTFKPDETDFVVDMAGYPNGRYNLKIITDQGFDVCDIIVEH